MNHRWIQQFRESVFFLIVKRNSVLQNKNQDEKNNKTRQTHIIDRQFYV